MKLFEIPMVVTSLVGLCFLAGSETPVARADFTFGDPVNVESVFPLFNPAADAIACFSPDGLEMYLESDRAGGQGSYDLWVYKRALVGDDWGSPKNLGPAVNSASMEAMSSITGDGLELYFCSDRPAGDWNFHIYVTRRATRDSPWGPPTNLGTTVNTSSVEGGPTVSSDGLELYFHSNRPGYGDFDLYVSKRATRNDPWGPASNLGPAVNSPSNESAPYLSPDGLLLIFQSPRPGGYGEFDLWMARRASRSAPWQAAVNLGLKINGPLGEYRACLAPDGPALYFMRDNFPYSKAPILPIVDFNGDGKVDLVDLVMLINDWGKSNSVCDIGPMSWGDGKVDIEDLKVFMTYYEKENPPVKP